MTSTMGYTHPDRKALELLGRVSVIAGDLASHILPDECEAHDAYFAWLRDFTTYLESLPKEIE